MTVVVRTDNSQESRIALFTLPVSGCAVTGAHSGIIARGREDGDAAGCCFTAKSGITSIDRNVHLVFNRVSRNRMGACDRRYAGVLVIGNVRRLVDDAEYRTAGVVRASKEVMIVAGVVPNFIVTVQTG